MFATAVVASAWISFGVLVRQYTSDCLHNGEAGVVLAGNHFEAFALTFRLGFNRFPNRRVLSSDI